MSRAYMQRVEVGAYYTDGLGLWRVTDTHPLGTVDLENAMDGRTRIMGISAFRRQFWLAATPPADENDREAE